MMSVSLRPRSVQRCGAGVARCVVIGAGQFARPGVPVDRSLWADRIGQDRLRLGGLARRPRLGWHDVSGCCAPLSARAQRDMPPARAFTTRVFAGAWATITDQARIEKVDEALLRIAALSGVKMEFVARILIRAGPAPRWTHSSPGRACLTQGGTRRRPWLGCAASDSGRLGNSIRSPAMTRGATVFAGTI